MPRHSMPYYALKSLASPIALAIAGIAGALYSSSRADSDCRSHDDGRQARAELDRHTSFQHEGHTYVRQTVYKGGQQYHKFNRQD